MGENGQGIIAVTTHLRKRSLNSSRAYWADGKAERI